MAAALYWLSTLWFLGGFSKQYLSTFSSLLAAETGACWQNISILILSQHIHRIMTQDGPLGVLLPLQNFNIFSSGFFKNHQQQSMPNAHLVILDKLCCNFFSMQWTWNWRCLKTMMCPSPFIFRSMQHVDLTILHVQTSFIVYGNIILEFLWLVNWANTMLLSESFILLSWHFGSYSTYTCRANVNIWLIE